VTYQPALNRSNLDATLGGRRAIVIGGGIAGLLSARVLADHFDQVTIVDRDRFPEDAQFRKGVPQGHHTHYLMIRGRLILEQLFPGFEAEMITAGAVAVDLGQDLFWLNRVGVSPRFRSHLSTFFCSRSLMEWGVRRRLIAAGQTSFVEASDVIGLLPTADNRGVAGVRLRSRDRSADTGAAEQALYGDLVVDASGYSSRAPRWLEALGYVPPPEIVVKPFRGYATRYYTIPSGLQADWKALIIQSKPPLGTRYGQLFPMEGKRWMLTLIGAAHDYPPTDEAGFLEFARSLPSPLIYEAIKDAQPASPIYGYQHTENRMRSYERMERWPEGFVALGDSVCTLNPSYAQGITAAAFAALTLDQCLRDRPGPDRTGLARSFQQALAKTNAPLWEKSISDDMRYAKTAGGTPGYKVRFMHWYMDQTLRLAMRNHGVFKAFMSWMQLLAPLDTLFHPKIMAQVLAHALIRRQTVVTLPRLPVTSTSDTVRSVMRDA
jgi:flavin-dependent dehydrogenase